MLVLIEFLLFSYNHKIGSRWIDIDIDKYKVVSCEKKTNNAAQIK